MAVCKKHLTCYYLQLKVIHCTLLKIMMQVESLFMILINQIAYALVSGYLFHKIYNHVTEPQMIWVVCFKFIFEVWEPLPKLKCRLYTFCIQRVYRFCTTSVVCIYLVYIKYTSSQNSLCYFTFDVYNMYTSRLWCILVVYISTLLRLWCILFVYNYWQTYIYTDCGVYFEYTSTPKQAMPAGFHIHFVYIMLLLPIMH